MIEKWLCRSCDWVGGEEALLKAANPFEPDTTLVACPKCKAIEDIVVACDEPGCDKPSSCGFPVEGGYRRTCYEHLKRE